MGPIKILFVDFLKTPRPRELLKLGYSVFGIILPSRRTAPQPETQETGMCVAECAEQRTVV